MVSVTVVGGQRQMGIYDSEMVSDFCGIPRLVAFYWLQDCDISENGAYE